MLHHVVSNKFRTVHCWTLRIGKSSTHNSILARNLYTCRLRIRVYVLVAAQLHKIKFIELTVLCNVATAYPPSVCCK